MLPFENTSSPSNTETPSGIPLGTLPLLEDSGSLRMPWTVAAFSLAGWALSFGTAILLGTLVRPGLTWLKQRLFQVAWDAPFDSWSIHSLTDQLPYSSDRQRIYVLPEEDLVQLFRNISGGVDPDDTLLRLWDAATSFDLDEIAEGFTIGEMIEAVPDIEPEALHAIVFTFTPPAEDDGDDELFSEGQGGS